MQTQMFVLEQKKIQCCVRILIIYRKISDNRACQSVVGYRDCYYSLPKPVVSLTRMGTNEIFSVNEPRHYVSYTGIAEYQ